MKLLNQLKTLTRLLSLACTMMVSLSYVNNVVALETHLITLGSDKMISLDLASGAQVNVETWNRDEVEITYDDETQDINNYKISIDKNNNGLNISSKTLQVGSMQLWLNLKVPQKTQLCFFSKGGNINVSGLKGGLLNCASESNVTGGTVVINSKGGSINIDSAPKGANVKTAGGSIKVTNASKFVIAETGGGSINIETSNGSVLASTDAGKIMVKILEDSNELTDINLVSGLGDIWLYIPKNFSMKLDIEIAYTADTNGQYKVDSELPISLVKTNKVSVSGTPRQYLQTNVQVNGGQHKVKIRTTNGNVYIREI